MNGKTIVGAWQYKWAYEDEKDWDALYAAVDDAIAQARAEGCDEGTFLEREALKAMLMEHTPEYQHVGHDVPSWRLGFSDGICYALQCLRALEGTR